MAEPAHSPDQAPELLTQEPTGPITRAREPIPVLAVVHWAPPWGDGPLPVDGLALAWTPTQGLVQVVWLGGPIEVWVPAGDIHRVYQLTEPVDVTARVQTPNGVVDVPARAYAHAKSRAGEVVAQRVQLAPAAEQTTVLAGERWLLLQRVAEARRGTTT
jgi:hypothetical protein